MIVLVTLLTILSIFCAISIVSGFLMTVTYYWRLRKAIRATRFLRPYLFNKLNDFSQSYRRSFQVVLLLFLRRARMSEIPEVSEFGRFVRQHARKYLYVFLANVVLAVAFMGSGLAIGLLIMLHAAGFDIGRWGLCAAALVPLLIVVVARVGLARTRRILAVVLEVGEDTASR